MKPVVFLLSVILFSSGLSAQCPFSITETIFHTTACSPCNGQISINPTSGTPPYSYSWAVIGSTTPAVSGLCPGTYTVTITDAVLCTVTDTVEVLNQIMNISTNVSSPILCNGESTGAIDATASGSGPFTYAWSPSGGTDATATGLTANCYTVTVTDVNSCTKTAVQCIFQPPPLSLFASGNPSTCGNCNGDAAAIAGGGTSPYTYLWSNSATGQTTTGLCAGNYTVVVTDANNCTNSQVVNIASFPGPVCTVSVLTPASCSTCCDGVLQVNSTGGTSPFTYNWNPGGQTSATATGLCPGSYSVDVMDANGCVCTDTITLPFTIGIKSKLEETGFILFPNPVKDQLIIHFLHDPGSNDRFRITEISGSIIMEGELDDSGVSRIPAHYLKPGFYLIEIRQGGKVSAAFFIAS